MMASKKGWEARELRQSPIRAGGSDLPLGAMELKIERC